MQEQVIVQETPDVVAPLPLVEEFTEPVYSPVHQEQIVAGEMMQNIIGNSAMQEQVVDSPLPVEEFTEPVYSPVHHEQIVAGEMKFCYARTGDRSRNSSHC